MHWPSAAVPLACLLLSTLAALPGQEPHAPPGPAVAATTVPAGDRLLVCNKAAHTVSIFAVAERRELAALPTGRGPHEVAVAPDGRTAVVSDYGDQKPGHTLTVVDVVRAAVLRTIDLVQQETDAGGEPRTRTFLRPHGVQFVGKDRVVVTSELARRLLLVDVATGQVLRTWSTPQATMHMVAVDEHGGRAAATSIKDGNVVFFALDGAADAALPAIACGDGSEGLAVHPRTGHAWVGNRAADTLSIVDPATGVVVATLPTGDFPFRVAFARDGALALVTCAESGELQRFDGTTCAPAGAIALHGEGSELSPLPLGVATDPEGRRAYVTCGRGEYVAVVDLLAGAVVDRLPAGKGCDGVAYARPVAPAISR